MIPWTRPNIGAEEVDAVDAVLESGWLSQGEQVAKFEQEICAYVGCRFALCVTNGTMALALCYLALRDQLLESGLSVADDGIVSYIPNTTFAATSSVPIAMGIPFVPVDVDYHTGLSAPADYRDAFFRASYFHDSFSVLSPVHLFGSASKVGDLKDLIQGDSGAIIEDACQAFGVVTDEGMVGQYSQLCVFSFHIAKLVSTTEGGCIATNNETLYETLKLLRSYGTVQGYKISKVGLNGRMTDLAAAMGRAQLRKVERSIAHRVKLKGIYKSRLERLDSVRFLTTPKHVLREVPTMVPVMVPKPLLLQEALKGRGIDTRTFFPPLNEQYGQLNNSPKTERIQSRSLYDFGLFLPIGNGITEDEVSQVCDAVEEILS